MNRLQKAMTVFAAMTACVALAMSIWVGLDLILSPRISFPDGSQKSEAWLCYPADEDRRQITCLDLRVIYQQEIEKRREL